MKPMVHSHQLGIRVVVIFEVRNFLAPNPKVHSVEWNCNGENIKESAVNFLTWYSPIAQKT